ncbi:MAG: cadherin domain-containing protein, partial [Acidobacteria bacterium]|nr:cadherin domain-containing protein [Acidobacteriota bacterium]
MAFLAGVFGVALLAAVTLSWLPSTDPAQAQDDPAGPKITAGPTIISNPQNGDTYRAGETITITLGYSEAVTVSGKPRLRLMIGEQRRWAGYDHTGADDATLAFSHVVKSDDADADGITIRKNQLKLNGGTIVDADGNAANLNHPGLRNQGDHKVDGAPDQPQPKPEPEAKPAPEPANDEPQFAAGSAVRSVAELSLPGAAVGAPVAATDDDGDTLTYALAGADAGSFNLDAASGQISVRDALDYEAKASYAVTVTVHDGKNAAGEADASVDDIVTVAVA